MEFSLVVGGATDGLQKQNPRRFAPAGVGKSVCLPYPIRDGAFVTTPTTTTTRTTTDGAAMAARGERDFAFMVGWGIGEGNLEYAIWLKPATKSRVFQ